MENLVWKC